MTSCQAFYCTDEKRKSEKNCLCNYRSRLPLSTHRPVSTKTNTGKYVSIGDQIKRQKARVRIKRFESDSYLTYHQSCKTWNYTYWII